MTPFWRVWERSLLKTLWEKEKLLVQAITPFPSMFSTLSKTEIIIFLTFNLSSANAFNLVWSKILSCGNGLKNKCRFTNTKTISSDFSNIVLRFTNAIKLKKKMPVGWFVCFCLSDCNVLNAVLKTISVMLRQPLHRSMSFWSSLARVPSPSFCPLLSSGVTF